MIAPIIVADDDTVVRSSQQDGRVAARLDAGEHLLELISYILDLSSIEGEQIILQKVKVDPRAIAAACLELVRLSAEANGLALRLAVVTNTPTMMLSAPTRLRQVLLDLLGNAVKFTAQGGVEVQVGPSADRCALRVDLPVSGPGILTTEIDRLFQEFEHLDTDGSAGIEGSGLGLVLSRRPAEPMGGRLFHDDNSGGGSVLGMELPLEEPAVLHLRQPSGLLSSEVPAEAARQALHVLVVDDVLMNREIAGSFLSAAGHQVTCVEDGVDAVAAAAATDFDVILMDVRMPGMDGLEATRRIRRLAGSRGKVLVLALTAMAFPAQISECQAAGMDGHLAKPFTPERLLAIIDKATEENRQRQGARKGASAQMHFLWLEPMAPEPDLDVKTFNEVKTILSAELLPAELLADFCKRPRWTAKAYC